MWTTTTRQLSFNGTVSVSFGGAIPPRILKWVRLDAYRFFIDPDGSVRFERLPASARTDDTGNFSFTDVPVLVEVQTVIPGTPPYTPIELTQPDSLPNLAFRLSIEAEIISSSPTPREEFIELYDEREKITSDWLASHSERLRVSLSGSPTIPVLIPAEESEEAVLVAGMPPTSVPLGKTFHFLRVGRATRDEIGELGTAKPGYMNSATPSSFFPGIVDAPFGRTLHIGGQFGDALQSLYASESLYYTVSFGQYSGDPANPLASETQILDPLFNKVYRSPSDQWETFNLGPFNGTIDGSGIPVKVYKRPPLPQGGEYWPFWDLIAIWNSAAAPNELIVLELEAYKKTGGSEAEPVLEKLVLASPTPTNAYLPLRIDNRPPVPKFLPFDPSDTQQRKFHTAYAKFSPEEVWFSSSAMTGPGGQRSTPMNICNEMGVHSAQVDGNECILVRYSVEDGAGHPHQHLNHYRLIARFTPKALPSAPDSELVVLKDTFNGYNPRFNNYSPTAPPIMEVDNYTSVLVPDVLDSWPPEPMGDTYTQPPFCMDGLPLCQPCPQYAVTVELSCSVRTINGWARLFSRPRISRNLIIKST